MFQLSTASSCNASKQRQNFRKTIIHADKWFTVFPLRALRVICVLLSVTNYYHNWLPQSPQYSFIKEILIRRHNSAQDERWSGPFNCLTMATVHNTRRKASTDCTFVFNPTDPCFSSFSFPEFYSTLFWAQVSTKICTYICTSVEQPPFIYNEWCVFKTETLCLTMNTNHHTV